MPKLYILSGPDLGKTVEVSHGAVLGRALDCAVHLRHASVSRHHARLDFEAGDWRIVDLGSRNGVRVRGETASSRAIADGDEFEVGDVLLRFRSGGASDDAPPPGTTAIAPLRLNESDDPFATREPLGSLESGNSPLPLEPHESRAWFQSVAPTPSRDSEREPESPEAEDDEIVLEDWNDDAPTVAHGPRPLPTQAPRAPRALSTPAQDAREIVAPAQGSTRSPPVRFGAPLDTRAGVAVRSDRRVLQFRRVVSRSGFFSSDLGQQPGWVRASVVLLALALFALVFWFAFQSTLFLKARTQGASRPIEAQSDASAR